MYIRKYKWTWLYTSAVFSMAVNEDRKMSESDELREIFLLLTHSFPVTQLSASNSFSHDIYDNPHIPVADR